MFTKEEKVIIDQLRESVLNVVKETKLMKPDIKIVMPDDNFQFDMAVLLLNYITYKVYNSLSLALENETFVLEEHPTIIYRIDNQGIGYTMDCRWFLKPMICPWLEAVLEKPLEDIKIDEKPPDGWESIQFNINGLGFLLLIKMNMEEEELAKAGSLIKDRGQLWIPQSDSDIKI